MPNFNNPGSLGRIGLFAAVLSLLALVMSTSTPVRALPAAPQAAECQSGVGGRLFSNGGELEVEMLPSDAGFIIELHLLSPGQERFIATNRNAGSIVKLGSFQAGVELIFGVFVRDTQQSFRMGTGSGNPDGLPHAEVTCFGTKRSNIGFEDQFGGGDRDYNDLLCTVRQPQSTCNYSISPASQSFGSEGGRGTIRLDSSAGCSWTASSNVSWVTLTSGSGGSDSGTINYSVAVNTDTGSRSGTLSVQGQIFTVFQDGEGSQPLITSAVRSGKKMFVSGINFDGGSVLLLNGEDQKTLHDDSNPTTMLIGKKLGKWAQPGDKLRVRNSSGELSPEYEYFP